MMSAVKVGIALSPKLNKELRKALPRAILEEEIRKNIDRIAEVLLAVIDIEGIDPSELYGEHLGCIIEIIPEKEGGEE